ncbi:MULTISPECIES: hypothetical protein, partial [Pseudomonadota]
MKTINKITIEELNSSNSSVSSEGSIPTVRELSGISALGLMPPASVSPVDVPSQRYFITLALPHREKVLFNNKKIEY